MFHLFSVMDNSIPRPPSRASSFADKPFAKEPVSSRDSRTERGTKTGET